MNIHIHKRAKILLILIFIEWLALCLSLIFEKLSLTAFLLPLASTKTIAFMGAYILSMRLYKLQKAGKISLSAKLSPNPAIAGKSGEAILTLINDSAFPLYEIYFELEHNGLISLEESRSGPFQIPSHAEMKINLNLQYLNCGFASILGVRFEYTDISQLFTSVDYIRASTKAAVGVSPSTFRNRSIASLNLKQSKLHFEADETDRIREFVHGDATRLIAWKISAHKDKKMTRSLETHNAERVKVIVDLQPSMRGGAHDSFDEAASLALGMVKKNQLHFSFTFIDAHYTLELAAKSKNVLYQKLMATLPKLRNRYDEAAKKINIDQLALDITKFLAKYERLDFFLTPDEADLSSLRRWLSQYPTIESDPIISFAQELGFVLPILSTQKPKQQLLEILKQDLRKKDKIHQLWLLTSLSNERLDKQYLELFQNLKKGKTQVKIIVFPISNNENSLVNRHSAEVQRRNIAWIHESGIAHLEIL